MFWFLVGVGALAATGGVATGAVAGYAIAHGGIHPISRWSNYLGHGGYPEQFYGSYGQLYRYM
jgi:hypothetical protein